MRPIDPDTTGPLKVSPVDVAHYTQQAGFRGGDVITMVAIIGAESGFDAHSIGDLNLTEPGEMSVGLTQINYRPSRDPGDSTRDPRANLDPATNLRHAYAISGGGRSFRPWSTYNSGAYQKFLPTARAAAAGSNLSDGGFVDAGTTVVFDVPTTGPVTPITTGGGAKPGDPGDAVVGGSVDFTSQEVSEITLEIADPGLHILRELAINVGSMFRYRGMTLQAVEVSTTQGPANPHVILRLHPHGAVAMRSNSPNAVRGMSPTDYMAAIAKASGLLFVGEPSGTRGSIGPGQVSDTSGSVPLQRPETGWEVGKRLAGELGFLYFESAGTFYFGSPRYLIGHGRTIHASYEGYSFAGNYSLSVDLLEAPECHAGNRFYRKAGTVIPGPNGTSVTYLDTIDFLQDTSVTIKVERALGEQIRPGMNLTLAGAGIFDGFGKIVTHVSWDVVDETAPVSIEAEIAQELPASARTSADNVAAPVNETTGRGGRIDTSARERYFGQPGDRVRTQSYRTPWGMTVTVHDLVAGRFAAACEDAHANASWRPHRIDSYAVRRVRGRSDWSLHAFGLAWDMFSSGPNVDPPGGVWGPTSAPDAQFRGIFIRHGFYSGADYNGRKDYPHMEWASVPP